MLPDEPFLLGETEIKAIPIEPSYKDILDKVLEQNKMILEQNAQIIRVLSSPRLVVTRTVTDQADET